MTEVSWMEGAKEIEAPILVRGPFLSKGMGQVGTTREEWVKGISPKKQLSGEILLTW